jgi:hypothetical protein
MRGLFIFFLILSISCSNQTVSGVQKPENTAIVPDVSIEHLVFYDGTIFFSSEMLMTAKEYRFSENTYEIHLIDGYNDNYPRYVIEQGKYQVREKKLFLIPEVKLACQITGFNFHFLCSLAGDYQDGFLLHKDTVSIEDFKNLNFNEYQTEIYNIDNKLAFDIKTHFIKTYTQVQITKDR